MTLMETIYILNYKFDQIKIGFTIGILLSEIAMNCAELRVIVLEMCGIACDCARNVRNFTELHYGIASAPKQIPIGLKTLDQTFRV